MPSHQERIRKKNPEMTCNHIWIYTGRSDIAPFIEEDGSRTTVRVCINCGLHIKRNRSQEEFVNEMKAMEFIL